MNSRSFSNKLSHSVGIDTESLKFHLILTLFTAFGREVEDDRSSVEIHLLEDLLVLFELDNAKVKSFITHVSVTVRVGKDIELVVGRPVAVRII